MIRISLEEKARFIAKRKEELGIIGYDYVAPNSGSRRTPEKIELLRTIEREARAHGRVPRFRVSVGD